VSRLVAVLASAVAFAMACPAGAQSPTQASRYYEDALKRYEKNDVGGAVVQLKNALQQDPKLLAAYVLLGRAQLTRSDAAAAEEAFARALQLGVNRAEIAVPMAQALYDQGKYQALLERFPAELVSGPQRAELLVLRGHAYKGLGDADAALRAFEGARRVDPRFVPALVSQAELLAGRGQRVEAEKLADEALSIAPDNARVWTLKGSLELGKGDYRSALDAYGKALGADPKYVDARIGRVSLLIGLSRYGEIEQDLAYLKANSADDPRANYLNAVFLARRGDDAGARDALHEVVRILDPAPRDLVRRRAPEFLLLGGVAHYSLGAMEKARSYLEDYLQTVPSHVEARRLLGSAYLILGDPRAAISVLEVARQIAPKDADVLALLAAAHFARRQYQIATDYLEQAVTLSGGAPSVHATLGLSLLGTGQSDLGVEHLKRAFEKDPGQARAGLPLAALYLKRGQAKRATAIAEAVVNREPKNVAALNLLGAALSAEGDLKGARAAFEKALAIHGDFVAPQLNLARLDLREGKTDQARARLQRFVKDRPNDTLAMLELASVEERAKRLDEAVRWLEKIHAIEPRNIVATARLVDLYIARKEPDKALAAARETAAASPEDLTALAALCRAYLALGNDKEAQTILGRMTRIGAFDPVWQTGIAQYQLAARNPQGATFSLEKALTGDPDYLPAQVLLAEMELRAGEIDKAAQRAKAIVARHPSLAAGYRLRADVAMARNQHAEAIAGYRTALAKEESIEGAIALYRALIQGANAAKATQFMESWIKAHPSDSIAMRALAEGYLRAGDLKSARAWYEQVLRLEGDDAGVLNNLANILARQGDKNSLDTAERAHRLAPRDAAIQDTLGWIMVQQGQVEEGLRQLRDARLRDPDNAEIRYHLASALARSGRRDEARKELEPAMRRLAAFQGAEDARKLWSDLAAR
jgi:putative PEP-CTERM system TPR-repeat lipoprotein